MGMLVDLGRPLPRFAVLSILLVLDMMGLRWLARLVRCHHGAHYEDLFMKRLGGAIVCIMGLQ